MISAYLIEEGQLHPLEPEGDWLERAQWIDVVAPDAEEWRQVATVCALPLPELDEIDELEASSHHASYPEGLQVNCLFFHQLDGSPSNTNISFVFDGLRLVSVSSREVPHVRLLRIYSQRGVADLNDPFSILLSLQEIKVDALADEMEQSYRELEKISQTVLGREANQLEEAIDGLAGQEDVVGKVRLCLMDGQRDLKFVYRFSKLSKKQRKWVMEMLADIETLLPHNNFLSEKADFLLNAAQGFVSIEQSQAMKMFSIVALVFLPPTLIAAIYGMNFHLMPELGWKWGYPMALGMMLLAGLSPYLYFKRKGWF